jgi:glycosyltransferase involved in cell wall biosynthesis
VTTVLVNLTWLVPGVVGGSEESTTAALRSLADVIDAADASPDRLEVHLAVLAPFVDAHPDLVDRFPAQVAPLAGTSKVRRVLADQTWLAGRAVELGADVVHHAGGVVPLRHPGRIVLTVHDLQPLDLPANFSVAKRTYLRAMTARSLRVADVVVVPSEFTARRVRHHGLPADTPLRVVPWTVPEVDPSGVVDEVDPSGVADEADDRLAAELDGHRVVLYPAVPYAHKGHLLLLDAFAGVLERHPEARLVLTGGTGPLDPAVAERSARPDLSGRVLRTGRIPAGQLDALFDRADVVVVPSTYEGFGLPVLEAMVRRVRVLSSDAGSLPEVARPEDVVRPGGVSGWTSAMVDVLDEDPAARSDAVERAFTHTRSCGPDRTGRGLLEAYRTAAGVRP